MILNVVLFVLGVSLLQRQATLPSVLWTYALVPVFLTWVLLPPATGRLQVLAQRCWSGLACIAAGFLWAALYGHVQLADSLPEQWEGRDVRVSGVVAELPQSSERGLRFGFDVEQVQTPLAHVPKRISLNWYQESKRGGDATLPEVHAGQRWSFTVRLRRPRGLSNPNGFDYEAWLLERGIRASGYVRPAAGDHLISEMVWRPSYAIERARERIRARILAALPEAPSAGVLVALAIGDQQAISRDQWVVFTRTGVNHLMSISGLHITMLSGIAFAAVLWLWRRSARLSVRVAAVKSAAVAGFAVACGYALLTGFAVPAQRTVYMLAAVAAGLLLGLEAQPAVVLAFALFVAVALDPLCVLAPGFWLSFGAVAVIMYVTLGRIAQPGWLVSWVRVQWAVTVGLTPVLVALFQQVSVVSPLANAIAIPVVSLAVVPATLIGVVLPVDWGLQLAAGLMSLCTQGLAWLSALPAAVWQQHAPPAWSVSLASAGVAWLLAPRGLPARWLGLAAFLPLVLVQGEAPGPGELWVDVLDVGQGLSAVVRTQHHTLLYDAGPAFSRDADAGSQVVVPFLRAQGVRRLDGMVITHDDSDHSGGARSVLEAMPVSWVQSSLPAQSPALSAARRAERCYAGRTWQWDQVRFTVLHPGWESYNSVGLSDNARGCVLKVEAAFGSVLLPADIERDSEQELVEVYPGALRAEVLLAPHHGSATSSSSAFLAAVAPRVVVIPVGYRNRFGHPKAEVLERYQELASRVLRTDLDGAIALRFSAQGLAAAGHRGIETRYWQRR